MSLHNAHVIEWYFWEFKKDKIWYWFPYKEIKPLFVSNVV